MFVEHKGYRLPENESATIWRYVDFAKFLDLLETQSLWFARLDQMEDLYEGFLPTAQIELLSTAVEALARNRPELQERIGDPRDRFLNEYSQRTRDAAYVNCWHLNEYESGAMWKIYGNQALAIKSTVHSLKESLSNSDTLNVHIGMVSYVDFESDVAAPAFEGTAMTKRTMYDFERELRAVILDMEGQLPTDVPGTVQPIDVSELIGAVYVGPGRAGWYVRLIKSLLERYGLPNVPVIRSAMDGHPLRLT